MVWMNSSSDPIKLFIIANAGFFCFFLLENEEKKVL